MNKIAKILSVVLSASIALTVAVVTLVSALAADTPVFTLEKVSEDDTTYVVSINLKSGKFNNATFEVVASKDLTACTSIDKGAALKTAIMDKDAINATNPETGKASVACTNDLDEVGVYFIYTFTKASGAEVDGSDFTITEKDLGAKVENNIKVVVPEATAKPVETTTKAVVEKETTTKAVAETTTKAVVEETTTEKAAEVETTTEAVVEEETTTEKAVEVETTTEAIVEEETTTEEAVEVETTTEAVVEDETTTVVVVEDETADTTTAEAVVEDGTTAEAVVVNPNTGDSATASAAIVALLAISGAAVVALRKKED